MSEIGTLMDIEGQYVNAVFGHMDKYVKKIEKDLHVSVIYRE